MGTEVAVSFSALRAQLENERSTLYKIDANIKKIVQNPGRYSDRFKNPSADYGRNNARLGSRNTFPESGNNHRNDDIFANKKGDTKTVFSRLSGRVHDSDGEEEAPGPKRMRMSSAVSRELPSRAEVVRAQGGDERARTRNRRIFGSLLGTLQKFKQEEIVLQNKEEKKAQVERKIEEQARQQKEKEITERKTLFAEREHKKATIRALEAKMSRVEEFECWETSQKSLSNFILTKSKPPLYWLPQRMSAAAEEKLQSSRSCHEKNLARKRHELEEELQRIEQRCLRPRAPGAGEPGAGRGGAARGGGRGGAGGGARGRDKFATDDADDKDKEDSDNEDHHKQKTGDTEYAPAEAALTEEAMDTSSAEPPPPGEEPAPAARRSPSPAAAPASRSPSPAPASRSPSPAAAPASRSPSPAAAPASRSPSPAAAPADAAELP